MGLHTLQLSYRPRQHRVPQVLKVTFWGLVSWGLIALVVWLIGLAVCNLGGEALGPDALLVIDDTNARIRLQLKQLHWPAHNPAPFPV